MFAVVSQPIEIGGKRGVAPGPWLSLIVTSRASLLRSIERQIALDTVRAYMRAVRARDVIATLASQREGVATLVATMRRRVEEGFAPESDLLRFEAEAARMGVELTRTEIELTRSLLDLGALIASSTPVAAIQLVSPEPIAPPAMSADTFEVALDQRPDLLLAASRVDRSRLTRRIRAPAPTARSVCQRWLQTDAGPEHRRRWASIMALPLFDHNAQSRVVADANARAASFERDASPRAGA